MTYTTKTIQEIHTIAMDRYQEGITILSNTRQTLPDKDSSMLILAYMNIGEFAIGLAPLIGTLNAWHDLAGTVTSKKENNITAEDCKLIEEARSSVAMLINSISSQTILAQQYIKITKEL